MKFPTGDLFVLFFFLIGLSLAGIAWYIYRSHQELVKNGISTKGIVIGMHRIKPREYPVAPSIRYRTLDGIERVFHSSEGRNPPAYQIGEEVTLYYNPSQPDDVVLEGDYLLVYVFGGMGFVFMLISVWGVGSAISAIWKWMVVS
ncbi:DUF3592 domain-containing protein [Spirosoma sp. BT702]|uniref:DUF3592 domain-containing protein n=1 Tax=Spirosoma profusum TaxID=2771354 RepID=A0A926XUC7_9BACT|nr:DUF3592 domain-containing protein [Spirosoma profusum]MBD2700357.1 DUF3592 domain-containing protein [Spirosoma profusum]